MKKIYKLICVTSILAAVLLLASCTPGVSGVKDNPDNTRDTDTTKQEETKSISYVTVKNVENGILFSGTWPYKHEEATINIKDNANNIEMFFYDTYSAIYHWTLIYPLVEKGKEYSFTVTAKDGPEYIIYEENFNITAEGGLGEFKIENTDKYKLTLTDDKLLKKAVKAEYTNNPNIKLQREGIYYDLQSGTKYGDESNYYFVKFYNMVNSTDDTLDITKPFKVPPKNNWESWSTTTINPSFISGYNLCVGSRTRIQISGYTYNGNVYFDLNDYETAEFAWGGEKAKNLIAYGISISGSNGTNSYISKEELESLQDEYEILNMPVETNCITFSEITTYIYQDDIEEEIDTKEYLYTQVLDGICCLIEEPKITPILQSKDGKTKFRFVRWSNWFPYVGWASKGQMDNKDAFINKLYAVFEIVE